jgi:hypothetical protein
MSWPEIGFLFTIVFVAALVVGWLWPVFRRR